MANNRLLIIEDDFDVAEMLVMYFESHKYEVFHADSGKRGIEMARVRFPNVILLDVMMPDMDGYDVCQTLRQTAFTKYIPIIFLTQRDERANKVKGLELGADDYVTKPFDVDELRLRVQGAIRRAATDSLHEARTGLPTGPLIEEELARHEILTADDHGKLAQLHLSLNHYSAYRDTYGFLAANEVVGFAARCIKESVSHEGTPNDFVGIKDDDFVILTHGEVLKLRSAIEQKFKEGIRAFYSFADTERGGILLNSGTDEERLEPLIALTVTTGKREAGQS